MQQTQKAAAKSKAQRLRHFRLELQRGVVELELLERISQRLVLIRLDRIEPGKDRGFDFLESWQCGLGRLSIEGDGIAHLGSLQLLDA